MAELMTSDLFLVGSGPVASDTPDEVFRLCSGAPGNRSIDYRGFSKNYFVQFKWWLAHDDY